MAGRCLAGTLTTFSCISSGEKAGRKWCAKREEKEGGETVDEDLDMYTDVQVLTSMHRTKFPPHFVFLFRICTT